MSHLYEDKIKNMGNAGRNGGEYYTSRSPITTIVVETQKLEAVYQKKMDDLEELKKSFLQKGIKLAVVEAKSAALEVGDGVMQAKKYAEKLKLETTYSHLFLILLPE